MKTNEISYHLSIQPDAFAGVDVADAYGDEATEIGQLFANGHGNMPAAVGHQSLNLGAGAGPFVVVVDGADVVVLGGVEAWHLMTAGSAEMTAAECRKMDRDLRNWSHQQEDVGGGVGDVGVDVDRGDPGTGWLRRCRSWTSLSRCLRCRCWPGGGC